VGATDAPRLTISFFDHCADNLPKQLEMDFCGLAEYLEDEASTPAERSKKADEPSIVPATFSPLRRAKANVTQRFMFTGDVDDATDLDMEGMSTVLSGLGLAHILHSTTKSTLAANRYRVLIPYLTPLSWRDSEAVSSSLQQMIPVFDTKTFDAGRLSIIPRKWHGLPEDYEEWDEATSHHAFIYSGGEALDAHAIMAEFPPIIPDEPDEADLSAILGAAVTDYGSLTDFSSSPLITDVMVSDYHAAPAGGRFYKFMVRIAGRALAKGIAVDEGVILSLARQMNARADNRSRPNGLHEARRALRYAASQHVINQAAHPGPVVSVQEQKLQKEIERLRRRKVKTDV